MEYTQEQISTAFVLLKATGSLDNSACEGLFGRLKTEMFYGRDWEQYNIDDFIQEIDTYIHWYRSNRIKSTLRGLALGSCLKP